MACVIVNAEGEGEDIDNVFVKGDIHKDGKERKLKSHKASETKIINSEQCKHQSTFMARLKEDKLEDKVCSWSDGKIICLCCNQEIPVARKMKRHSKGTKHMKKLEQWKLNKVQ